MAGSERGRWPFGLDGPLGALRPLDLLVALYALVSGVPLAVGAMRGLPGFGVPFAANIAIAVFAIGFGWASRATGNAALAFVRLVYVPVLFVFFYDETALIGGLLYDRPFDGTVAALDQALFGLQPSTALAGLVRSHALSEVFCFAYFAYYFYSPVLFLTALARYGYLAAERIVFAVAFCFYCCYTVFWLYPTVGPHYWFPPHTGPELYDGYVFNHLLFAFTSRGEVPAGAFPSSHVAVAVLLTIYARREVRRLFPIYLAVTTTMGVAVVYLRAHYVVDVPAGVTVGVLFALIADPVRRRLGRWLTPRSTA